MTLQGLKEWVVKLDDGSANTAADLGEAQRLISVVLATENPCELWHTPGYRVARYTRTVHGYRCPCCGDDVVDSQPVCQECRVEGCELSKDASGEWNWWECQRPRDGHGGFLDVPDDSS